MRRPPPAPARGGRRPPGARAAGPGPAPRGPRGPRGGPAWRPGRGPRRRPCRAPPQRRPPVAEREVRGPHARSGPPGDVLDGVAAPHGRAVRRGAPAVLVVGPAPGLIHLPAARAQGGADRIDRTVLPGTGAVGWAVESPAAPPGGARPARFALPGRAHRADRCAAARRPPHRGAARSGRAAGDPRGRGRPRPAPPGSLNTITSGRPRPTDRKRNPARTTGHQVTLRQTHSSKTAMLGARCHMIFFVRWV